MHLIGGYNRLYTQYKRSSDPYIVNKVAEASKMKLFGITLAIFLGKYHIIFVCK